MAHRKKGELPRYRLHKQSGQAVVSLPTGSVPRYRDGPSLHNSPMGNGTGSSRFPRLRVGLVLLD
jgi:hypothetical protein